MGRGRERGTGAEIFFFFLRKQWFWLDRHTKINVKKIRLLKKKSKKKKKKKSPQTGISSYLFSFMEITSLAVLTHFGNLVWSFHRQRF